MSILLVHKYNDIISVENLLEAWKEFLKGKKKKLDVQQFQYKLFDNVFALYNDLKNKTYRHGSYESFNISDPKPRNIHKASVRDRLLHHAIYRILYPYFDTKFIADSFSCRKNKGTHKAVNRFHSLAHKVSQNNTKTCWVLKCDIKKFFASIDHQTLKSILAKHIKDKDVLWLLAQVIDSFNAEGKIGVGLPLGNLTSQLLANVYLNELDQFMKQELKTKHYIRYADDFVIFSQDKDYLEKLTLKINGFLQKELCLSLHPDKVFIKTLSSGVDFLGWVNSPNHRVLRTATKNRMFKKLKANSQEATILSYLGMLGHGASFKLKRRILTDPEVAKFCKISLF